MHISIIKHKKLVIAGALSVVLAACGDAPLGSVGDRSSGWINEPEVVTTTLPPVTVPESIGTETLLWSNDQIESESLGDPDALVAEVFSRREGDRFIQASRLEILTVLPDLQFPAEVPYGAEWVSSQLVIENSGLVGSDPSVAFGIWSAEPYTRSRSVAQMAVLRVGLDPDTALEVAEAGDNATCAKFSDSTTESCDLLTMGNRDVWRLSSLGGTTFIWFDSEFRYELFGRPFVPLESLEAMAADTIPLASVTPPAS